MGKKVKGSRGLVLVMRARGRERERERERERSSQSAEVVFTILSKQAEITHIEHKIRKKTLKRAQHYLDSPNNSWSNGLKTQLFTYKGIGRQMEILHFTLPLLLLSPHYVVNDNKNNSQFIYSSLVLVGLKKILTRRESCSRL